MSDPVLLQYDETEPEGEKSPTLWWALSVGRDRRRYGRQLRRIALIKWWWHRVNSLPGGRAYTAAYERVVYGIARSLAHAFGWHHDACRGHDCEPPPTWTRVERRFRLNWHRWVP